MAWPGCRCWFWSQDHREAHFHVLSHGNWEIRVFLGEEPPRAEVVWQFQKIPARALKDFLSRVSEQRQALFIEWDAKVQVVDP
ncbi:MAG TPA: DUF4160 domain-containing protein [Longimicrobium sp.]|nr:DUF4160 domain-containing protein [Longimicrobium sp.]